MTDPHEVPDEFTPVYLDDAADVLVAHMEELGVPVLRRAIELKLAHMGVELALVPKETDEGKRWFMRACHCWNVGNRKRERGHNWCRFACGEEVALRPDGSLPAVLQSPLVSRKGKPYMRGKLTMQSVWIRPPHPWSEFVAHETLLEGMDGQFDYLRRHPDVLAELETGDAREYNRALYAAGYYTADPGIYLTALRRNLVTVQAALKDWLGWGDVE